MKPESDHSDGFDSLLPWYVNGTLPPEDAARVQAHLAQCSLCRERVEALRALRMALAQSTAMTPQPRADLWAAIESQLDPSAPVTAEPHSPLREQVGFLWQLVTAQMRIIRRDLWPASAVVLILGWVVSYMLSREQGIPTGAALALLAPLIAALGLSVIYGPDSDAGLELAMTSQTPPQQVLLARFVLVFGYDFLLLLLLSVAFKLALPVVHLSALLDLWLGPMVFLSAMALLLSLAISTNAAIVASLIVWMIRVFAMTDLAERFKIVPLQSAALFWQSTPLLLGLAAALLAAGFVLISKEERFL